MLVILGGLLFPIPYAYQFWGFPCRIHLVARDVRVASVYEGQGLSDLLGRRHTQNELRLVVATLIRDTTHHLLDALITFNKFSGMIINNEKSGCIYSKAYESGEELQQFIQVPIREFPIKYLGLPFTTGIINHKGCGGFLSALEKVLSRWRSKKLYIYISYMGRVQLLN